MLWRRNVASAMSSGMWATLIGCGVMHALVDAACATMVFSAVKTTGGESWVAWCWAVAHDGIAFGSQSLFGLAVDKWRAPRLTGAFGCLLTAAGIMAFAFNPWLALCIAGIGNALFHVGAGCISLNLTPQRATAPGIFVAPGALGLALGTLAGNTGHFPASLFALLLVAPCMAIPFLEWPHIDYRRHSMKAQGGYLRIALMLLLLSILIRSFVGLASVFPWKSNGSLLIAFTFGIVGGKAIGGVLADRFGWLPVGVVSLLVSAPLIALGAERPLLAISGMFLFQMTMPITLAGVGILFPGRASFAFGLASLALLGGALPIYAGPGPLLVDRWLMLCLILVSALSILISLRLLSNHSRKVEMET